MIISANDVNFTVDTPPYGYATTINTALIISRKLPQGYVVWDNGVSNVSRYCQVNWLLSASDTDTLINIFNDTTKGRGISLYFKLGNNSGFFPFGPDLGDSGDFGIRLLSLDPSPVMEEPWLYFNITANFVMESNPAYSLPSQIGEGDLQIGGVGNLRYPPTMPSSKTEYGFATQVTYDGTAYTIDKTIDADELTTTLSMVCNHSKSAALINDMIVNRRDSQVTVVGQANNYLFGEEGGNAGAYTCYWLNESLNIKHNRYDEFAFDLSFYYIR